MLEDLELLIDHLPRYSSAEGESTGELTLTDLPDRAFLFGLPDVCLAGRGTSCSYHGEFPVRL